MSFGGILAQALAGGTAAIGKQAGDDIEGQRKADLMRQEADIREQAEKRLIEFRSNADRIANKNKLTDTRDFTSSDETLAANAKIARATSETNRSILKETLADEGLNEAQREKARKDALAAGKTAAEVAKDQAADPAYLKSISVLKLADPEVRARIAASAASANASAQQVKESAERLKQLQAVGEVATKVRGLQDTLSKTTDPAQRQAVEQQITDLGFNGKDIKSFLSTAERAMTNGDTAMKVLLDPSADEATKEAARRQLEQANQFATKAAGLAGIKLDAPKASGAPPVGTEVNGYVFKGGDPNDKKNWTPKAGAKPAGGGMLQSVKPEPDYRPASDGSGRMVDVTTGRTLTPEQSAVLAKIERGEPTTPGERALLNN